MEACKQEIFISRDAEYFTHNIFSTNVPENVVEGTRNREVRRFEQNRLYFTNVEGNVQTIEMC